MESLEEIARSRAASNEAVVDAFSSLQANIDKEKSTDNVAIEALGIKRPNVSKDASISNTALLGVVQKNQATNTGEAPFPQLSHNPPTSPDVASEERLLDRDEEEPRVAKSFERFPSPNAASNRDRGAFVEKVGEDGVSRMHKFSLYETATNFYIVGADLLDRRFRVLKIDRTTEPGELGIVEDDIVYTKKETNQILNAIDEGNRASGGLKLKASFWGLLGFIKFTGYHYILFVTKRSQVAMIGGHYLYQVDGTELIPLTTASAARLRADKNPEEARFMGILHNLDLSRTFYFSYSYDVTRTLQHNMLRGRQASDDGPAAPQAPDHNDMFVWNHHLLAPAKQILKNTYDWCVPIIHGYIDQAALSVYWGRVVYITIIARRSRFFAGARYLKRGANDLGYVANDVETEQIVAEMLTTSFHAPGTTLYANPNYTSYVQHRGSIPLYWTQDSTGVSPSPDIELNLVDPFYSATALHFDNLFDRYGTPICVLNLVKARERTPRESKLLLEYKNSIDYLNQFLPEDKKIVYHAWDMSRASKARDQDVIGTLETIAEDFIPKTGFFRNTADVESGPQLQCGIVRTNCIDCLDRTNAAQFVIGKKALGYQLQALGVINEPSVEYDSDAVNLFTDMWHDHGDTIAIQYGGSHLVNTMSTYRKINQWTSHSRDMVESLKRYYNNSFTDSLRQEAYNLFLGNYIFAQGQPMLWDLATDYYLHHSDPRKHFGRRRPSYRNWFTPSHLEQRSQPPPIWPKPLAQKTLAYFDDYWLEYYRPLAVSSFKKVFSYKMHSTLSYIPIKSTQEGRYDLSPFRVRSSHDTEPHSQTKSQNPRRKGVKIVMPSDTPNNLPTSKPTTSIDARLAATPSEPASKIKPNTLGPWLNAQQLIHAQANAANRHYTGIIKEPSFEAPTAQPQIPPLPTGTSSIFSTNTQPTKAELALASFTQLVARTLDPSVPPAERDEYERYVTHPLNIRIVVSSETQPALTPSHVFVEYISRKTAALRQDGDGGSEVYDDRNRDGNLREAGLREEFREFLEVGDVGLTVLEEDWGRKRYKAYRQWLRGKSLFKQRPVGGDSSSIDARG